MRIPTLARTLGFASSLLLSIPATAAFADTNIRFPLAVSAGAAHCLPHAYAHATVSSLGPVENMHVEAAGLPPKTIFQFFVIQVPTAPFGLAWYQGDLDTDEHGSAVADFTGRFSVETFIVAPGVAPAPRVFTKPPFPDEDENPKTNPVQLYHLGVWFDSPADAKKAGCAATVTPFNGTHDGGIQALNTANFPAAKGPLYFVH